MEVTSDVKELAAGFYGYKLTPMINLNSSKGTSGLPITRVDGKILITR